MPCFRIYSRAAWKEGKRSEEGVVPLFWIVGDKLFWPPCVNAEKTSKRLKDMNQTRIPGGALI